MFSIASKIFELIFAPAHFLIFLAVIGAALLYTRFSVLGRRLAATAAIALLVMAFGPVGQFLAAPLETRFASPPDDLPAPDGVIVLGGAVDEKHSALPKRPVIQESAERLTARSMRAAAPYLANGRVQQVLKRFEIAPLGIYAVLPSNRYIPHRVSVLIEHLARVLGASAQSLKA